jgi:hypothetical protein
VNDGGVLIRLQRRARELAIAGSVAGVLVAVTAWLWPGWAAGLGAQIVAGLLVGAAAVGAWLFGTQAGRWASAAGMDVDAVAVTGSVGAPVPMAGRKPGAPIRRRLPPVIVPVKAELDGLRDGDALVVHARRDGIALAGGDPVRIAAVGPRGPWLVRRDDGAVFAAERGITGVL